MIGRRRAATILITLLIAAGCRSEPSSARDAEGPGDVELLRVPRDGGAVERVATIPDYDTGATLHPDGRTIAYRTGESRGEIWALDGVAAAGTQPARKEIQR